jgi:hypothetical protein
MRTTEDLIAGLSARVAAVPPHAAVRRLAVAACVGALVAFLFLLATLGIRPDIAAASITPPFWMKWMFTLGLAALTFGILLRLGRPDARMGWIFWGVVGAFAAVELMGLSEWLATAPANRLTLVAGHTALRCSLAIPLLAVPVFFALVRAFSRLAPTRLRLTGAMVGLLAGAMGAGVYAFACPEHAAAFMAVWYCLGILVSAALGAVIGPRFLRW